MNVPALLAIDQVRDERESFVPTEEERKYVADAWSAFYEMYVLKNQTLDILDGRNLQQFWDDSNRDYACSVPPSDPNDPVHQYVSSISRDKSDVFIANLTGQLLFPSVLAQNEQQETDRTVSKVSKALLEFATNNDGYPSENGHVKMCRYIHKCVVEGTVHVADDVDKENLLTSSLVPNEEIYIRNFYQPDIQKQPILIRAQLDVTWGEAEALYGHLENFKYVKPGFQSWYMVTPEFKGIWEGILEYDRVNIMHVWRNATGKEIAELKKEGRIPREAKRAKWFCILINDIPVIEINSLSPYKDGLYPISKGIFTKMAKPEFYFGNSQPNKIRADKSFIDAWKTLLRYKGKLNILKPLLAIGGEPVDEEIILPSKITPVPEGLQIQPIEGVADPISQADVNLMQMAEQEIDRGSMAPRTAGQQGEGGQTTAREVVIQESNAQKVLDSFSQEVAFLVQARTFPILMRIYQFVSRKDIARIAITDQELKDGLKGTLDVRFGLPDMNGPEDELAKSFEIRQEEMASRKAGNPKDIVYIDPKYVKSLNYYVKADAASGTERNDLVKRQQFNSAIPFMLANPDLFDRAKVGQSFVRLNEISEDILAKSSGQMPPQPMQGQPGQQPQGPSQAGQMMPPQTEMAQLGAMPA